MLEHDAGEVVGDVLELGIVLGAWKKVRELLRGNTKGRNGG